MRDVQLGILIILATAALTYYALFQIFSPVSEGEYLAKSLDMMLEYVDREGECYITIGKNNLNSVKNCNGNYVNITDERTGFTFGPERIRRLGKELIKETSSDPGVRQSEVKNDKH